MLSKFDAQCANVRDRIADGDSASHAPTPQPSFADAAPSASRRALI
jgi:hypothetical protein